MCVVTHDLPVSLSIKAIVSGLLLTSWDFYLDPQMTRVEYWVWHTTTPSLPGISGIPLTNYLGWFLAGTMMSFIILRFIREQRVNSFLPKVVFLWTIVGGFILHAIFWRNFTVGLWGAAAMGTIWIVVEKTTRRT
jgi:putative membrane protein